MKTLGHAVFCLLPLTGVSLPVASYADSEFDQEVISQRGVQQAFWLVERERPGRRRGR